MIAWRRWMPAFAAAALLAHTAAAVPSVASLRTGFEDELKRVKELPQVADARAAVDAARTPPAARTETPEAPRDEEKDGTTEEPTTGDGDRADARESEEKPDAEFNLYPPGDNPSFRLPMKSQSLTATDRLRVGQRVSASLSSTRLTDADRDTYDSFFRSYSVRRGTTTQAFRLNLRSTQADAVYSNAVVELQYFVRDLSRGGGRIDPIEAQVRCYRVPELSAAGVWLDCPPLATRAVTTSGATASYYGNYHALNAPSRTGKDFYGLVVSVFGEDGKLLFQGCSNVNLGRLGAAAAPRSLKAKKRTSW